MLDTLHHGCLAFSQAVCLLGMLLVFPSCNRFGFEPPESNPCRGVSCSHHGSCVLTADGEAICFCDPGFHNQENTQCVADEVECLVDLDCDDADPCTDDVCDEALLCQHPFNTAPCDDGLFCTAMDACSNGSCLGSGDPCPGQTCDEASNACAECLADGDCDDQDPCTDDACNAGSCGHAYNTAPCDDGLFCTAVDACLGGSCLGSGDSCPGQMCDETSDACAECLADGDCDDGEICTNDRCPAGACMYTDNDGAACDDGLFCTLTDLCAGGSCLGSGDPCPAQGCDEANDVCTACVSDADCADGDLCNGDETCDAGTCLPGSPLSCDDGQYCNGAETCDPLAGCQAGSDPCGTAMCNSCNELTNNCFLELGASCAPDTPQAERGDNPMYCQDGLCTHWCNNSFEVPGDSDHECPADFTCWMHMDTDGAGFCIPVLGGTAATGEPCNDHPDCRSQDCLNNVCSDTCSSSLDCTGTGPNTSGWSCLVWEYFLKSGDKTWFDHGGCEPAQGSGVIGEACASSMDCREGCFTNPDSSKECRNLCCSEDDCSADRICWPYLGGWTISTVRTCEVKEPRGPNGFDTPCTATEFYDPDCTSGLCLDTGQGERCNRFCCRNLDCPPGFRCEFAFLLPRGGNKVNSMRACIPE